MFGTQAPQELTGWASGGDSGLTITNSSYDGTFILTKTSATTAKSRSFYWRDVDGSATANSITAAVSGLSFKQGGSGWGSWGIALRDNTRNGQAVIQCYCSDINYPVYISRGHHIGFTGNDVGLKFWGMKANTHLRWLRLVWDRVSASEMNVTAYASLDNVLWFAVGAAVNTNVYVNDVDKVGFMVMNGSGMEVTACQMKGFHFEETGASP